MKVLAEQAAAEARAARARLAAMRRRDAELAAEAVAEREEVGRYRMQLRQEDQSRGPMALLDERRAWAAVLLDVRKGWPAGVPGFIQGHVGFTIVGLAGIVVILCLGMLVSRLFVVDAKEERPTVAVFANTHSRSCFCSFFKMLVNGCAQCACGYTMHTRILLNSIGIAWFFGLGVMWHAHILQPFVEQVVVVLVFASLVVAIVLLTFAEMYILISGEVSSVFHFLGHLTKQLDGVMYALGFREFKEEEFQSPAVDAVQRSYKAQKHAPRDLGELGQGAAGAAVM